MLIEQRFVSTNNFRWFALHAFWANVKWVFSFVVFFGFLRFCFTYLSVRVFLPSSVIWKACMKNLAELSVLFYFFGFLGMIWDSLEMKLFFFGAVWYKNMIIFHLLKFWSKICQSFKWIWLQFGKKFRKISQKFAKLRGPCATKQVSGKIWPKMMELWNLGDPCFSICILMSLKASFYTVSLSSTLKKSVHWEKKRYTTNMQQWTKVTKMHLNKKN